MTREQKKNEAIKRMKNLGLHENAIKEFETEDKLNLSENGGCLYWLNDDEKKRVQDFEKQYNAVVYHVIHNFTEFGEMYSYLYVSDHEEEWEYDNADLKDGYCMVYVYNATNEWCSEFGSIGIEPRIGGLVRVA